MNSKALGEMVKYYFTEYEGWEGVWKRNYKKITAYPIAQRSRLRLTLEKRFGPNMRRIFMENLYHRETMLSRVKKESNWAVGVIPVPLIYEAVK